MRIPILAALLLVLVLTACDDDEAPADTTTPTSKGACANSYYEDAFSSSDALSLHHARLGDREVWVLRCPNFLRSNQTLVLAVAPDGWSMHVRVPQA